MTTRLYSKSLIPPPPGRTFGDVMPLRNHEASTVERSVRTFLKEHGFPARKQAVLVHHPDPVRKYLTLHPDICMEEYRLAIEVDPCGPAPGRGSTHRGKDEEDLLRNDLLAAVGWTVIRLRLGAAEGMHVGPRDVVVESSTFTKAAQAALVEAVEDFRHDRPPVVRFVPKSLTPKSPARRRVQVANIGVRSYADDGHIFWWYPTREPETERITMRLAMSGRYIYTHEDELFVEEVGLHKVSRDDWRQLLTEALQGRDPGTLGTTKWPWGETLLTAGNDPAGGDVVVAADHYKHTIDRREFWFTVSGSPVIEWTDVTLMGRNGTVAAIKPGAAAVGYRFVAVDSLTGRYGGYQRLVVSRRSVREAAAISCQ